MLYTVATDAEPSFALRDDADGVTGERQSVSSVSFFTRTRPARGCVRCVSAITFQIKFITAMMHPRCTRHYTGNSYLSDSV